MAWDLFHMQFFLLVLISLPCINHFPNQSVLCRKPSLQYNLRTKTFSSDDILGIL